MKKSAIYILLSLFLMAANYDPDEVLSEKLKQAQERVESADEAGAIELYEPEFD
ncbi:MAG: hypothetical protein WEA58_10750 [Balneolaceae bacterium]